MRKKLRPCLIVLTMSLIVPPVGNADSYRCGRKLIRTGDTSADVLRVCGQPEVRDRGQADVSADGVTKAVVVERWHYKQGARSLSRIVNIYRGRVVSIEVGSR